MGVYHYASIGKNGKIEMEESGTEKGERAPPNVSLNCRLYTRKLYSASQNVKKGQY